MIQGYNFEHFILQYWMYRACCFLTLIIYYYFFNRLVFLSIKLYALNLFKNYNCTLFAYLSLDQVSLI